VSNDNQLVEVTKFNTKLNAVLGTNYDAFVIYKSKGLLTHLLKRKHFIAIKYIDYLPEIINQPDYVGIYNQNIEMVKCLGDNIFVSIKIDAKKSKYYISTVFDVKESKISSYVASGRLIEVKKT